MLTDSVMIWVGGCLLWASYRDLLDRVIPPVSWVLLLLIWCDYAMSTLAMMQIWSALEVSLLALLCGIILYALGVWGAGDAKLLPVCLLWTSSVWQETVMLMALFGGLLSVFYLLKSVCLGQRNSVPFGVAMAAGTMAQLNLSVV